MRLIVEGEQIKVQNFVEYLIENYNEKGKTYEFEFQIEDRYDRKALESRENTLNEKLLVQHSEGFEILEPDYSTNLNKFNEKIKQIFDNESLTSSFTQENFVNQFVHFKIFFLENEQRHLFNFSFINLAA